MQSTIIDAEIFKTDIREFSDSWKEHTPKTLCETIIRKWKYDKSYLYLISVNVDNIPFCVLCNITFLNGIKVPIKSQDFQGKHLEFKEKAITYFKC